MKSLRIKDPKTKRYVANLMPKQKLELTISDPSVKVVYSGMLLENTSNYNNTNNERVMVMEPAQSILKHSYLSNHYLGEITVGTEYSILVYLQSSLLNKKTISIINPYAETLRIKPYNIIEFIYCSEYDKDISWSWTYPTQGTDIDIIELDYKKTISGSTKPKIYDDFYYAHPREIFDDNSTIHHFFFKLGDGLTKEIHENPAKNVEIGRLAVEGFKDEKQDECYVDIYCDLLPKWESEKKSKSKKLSTSYHTDYDSESRRYDDYNERIYSYNRDVDYTYSDYYYNNKGKNYYSNNHRSFPQCAKVNFSIIPVEDIYDGCKIIGIEDLEVEEKEKDIDVNPYYNECDCY